MNDRLLFRVYDLVNHCYLPTDNGLYFKIEDKRSVRSVTWFFDKKKYCVEQSTGLRDVNKKLIFAGDKVEVEEFDFDGESRRYVGRVSYYNGEYDVETDEDVIIPLSGFLEFNEIQSNNVEVLSDSAFNPEDFFVRNNENGGVVM